MNWKNNKPLFLHLGVIRILITLFYRPLHITFGSLKRSLSASGVIVCSSEVFYGAISAKFSASLYILLQRCKDLRANQLDTKMENSDTLNLSSDQLRGLLSLLIEGKLQQVVGQGAKGISGSEMNVLPGTTQGNSSTKSAGNDGDSDFNVSLGSSLGDPAAAEYTAWESSRELLEKAGQCKKANPAQQIFRVSKLWFSACCLR